MSWEETWALVKSVTGDKLAKAAGVSKAIWNTVQAVGPYTVAQWDRASQAHARHRARIAMVEVGKDFLKEELAAYAAVKKDLLAEYGEATPKRKLQIQQDLEYLDRKQRQVSVGLLAIGYASTLGVDIPRSAGAGTEQRDISPHWIDRFNELAQLRNEEWRENLLGRALAAESASPGAVTPRALWFLGTVEENMVTVHPSTSKFA
jgi:hypothetical protein